MLFSSLSAMGYDFSEQNADGVIMYYNIVSENDKTCAVTAMEDRHSWHGNDTITDYVGDIRIPSFANGYRVTAIDENAFSSCKLTSSSLLLTSEYFCCSASVSSKFISQKIHVLFAKVVIFFLTAKFFCNIF